jgi:hypothetical protein
MTVPCASPATVELRVDIVRSDDRRSTHDAEPRKS